MGKVKDYYMEDFPAAEQSAEPYGPQLTIVRGLPGSGKSTYAKTLDCVHYEADQFFELDGEYVYDINLISAAHDWCYGKTVRALRHGHDVVVSNTFTKMWELDRYLAIPAILSLPVVVEIVEMKTQYQNVHGVPEDKLKQMAARWEDLSDDIIELGINFRQIEK